MAKGKSKDDAENVETQDESIVSQSVTAPAVTAAPDPEPAPVADPVVVVEEPTAASEGVKVGDYVDTPYGPQRVRAVFANGLVSYATPGGFTKKIQLPQG